MVGCTTIVANVPAGTVIVRLPTTRMITSRPDLKYRGTVSTSPTRSGGLRTKNRKETSSSGSVAASESTRPLSFSTNVRCSGAIS
jgi:hypothetical protein